MDLVHMGPKPPLSHNLFNGTNYGIYMNGGLSKSKKKKRGHWTSPETPHSHTCGLSPPKYFFKLPNAVFGASLTT